MFNQTVLQNALYGEHVSEHVKTQWHLLTVASFDSGNKRQTDEHAHLLVAQTAQSVQSTYIEYSKHNQHNDERADSVRLT